MNSKKKIALVQSSPVEVGDLVLHNDALAIVIEIRSFTALVYWISPKARKWGEFLPYNHYEGAVGSGEWSWRKA